MSHHLGTDKKWFAWMCVLTSIVGVSTIAVKSSHGEASFRSDGLFALLCLYLFAVGTWKLLKFYSEN